MQIRNESTEETYNKKKSSEYLEAEFGNFQSSFNQKRQLDFLAAHSMNNSNHGGDSSNNTTRV